MATEKTLKTRVVLKHDTEANWETAGNATNPFIPKKGEVIIYDPDDTHTCSRQKVGDGIKNVNELPFLGATVGMADSFESLSKIQYTAESAIPPARPPRRSCSRASRPAGGARQSAWAF